MYENSVNAEGFDVLDEYYTLCTEKLNALNDAVGAVRQQMQSLEMCIRDRLSDMGKVIFIVTHDFEFVCRTCSRVLHFDEGEMPDDEMCIRDRCTTS